MSGKKTTVTPNELRFYYVIDNPEQKYSYTPSHDISIPRILSGLPAFRNMGSSKTPHKKILVIAKNPSLNLSNKQQQFRKIRLDWLTLCGFTLHLDEKKDQASLIEKYQCTASTLYYFNDNDEEGLSSLASDDLLLIPTIKLIGYKFDENDNILGQFKEVRSLTLENCSGDLSVVDKFNNKNLSQLNLMSTPVSSCFLNAIPDLFPDLTELSVSDCLNLSGIQWRDNPLPHLITLMLKRSPIPESILFNILTHRGPYLKKLWLVSISENPLSFDFSGFSNLKSLDIRTPVNSLVLSPAAELEFLSSTHFLSFNSTRLLYLYLKDYCITPYTRVMPELQTLRYMNCTIEDAVDVSEGFHLSKLTSIQLENCTIQIAAFFDILALAPNLKTLLIINCTFQDSDFPVNKVTLSHLHNISIKNGNMSLYILYTILSHATNLRCIRLSDINLLPNPDLTHAHIQHMRFPYLEELLIIKLQLDIAFVDKAIADSSQLSCLILNGADYSNVNLAPVELGALKKFLIKADYSEVLLNAIKRMTSLETLEIRNRVGGSQQISPRFPTSIIQNLTSFTLNEYTLSEAMINDLLQFGYNLKTLSIIGCFFEKPIFEHFTHATLVSHPIHLTLIARINHLARYVLFAQEISQYLHNDSIYFLDPKLLEAFNKSNINIRQQTNKANILNAPHLPAYQHILPNPNMSAMRPHVSSELLSMANHQPITKTIDIDTLPEHNTYKVDSYYIGHKGIPNPNTLRLETYHTVTITPSTNPFELSNVEDLALLDTYPSCGIRVKKSKLLRKYHKTQNVPGQPHFLGSFDKDVTQTWTRLPSKHPEETLEYYAISDNIAVKIVRNPKNGFHYIKSTDGNSKRIHFISIIKIADVEPSLAILPNDVRHLIEFCNDFKSGDFPKRENITADDYIKLFEAHPVGACRHRVIYFWLKMAQIHPQIFVQMIFNTSHAFVEIGYAGHILSADLGGYPSKIAINETQQSDLEAILASSQHEIRDGFNVLSLAKKRLLLDTSDVDSCIDNLLAVCIHTSHPHFYVSSPDYLVCQAPYILKQENTGEICLGPGGPLYDFIKTYPNGVIIINYQQFSVSDMIKFNAMLDPNPTIQGIPLNGQKIIVVYDKSADDAYQGADLYSRFEDIIPFDLDIPSLPPTSDSMDIDPMLIELCGGEDWSARLIGSWRLKDGNLFFEEGVLLRAIKAQQSHFILNHPPENDNEFERFIKDLTRYQAVIDQGRTLYQFQQKLVITKTKQFDLVTYQQWIIKNETPPVISNMHLLNPGTISHLLGSFQINAQGQLQQEAGLFEQYSGQIITLFVTEKLSHNQWLTIIEAAKHYHTKIVLWHSPSCVLPDYIASSGCLTSSLPIPGVTFYIQPPRHYLSLKETIEIDVSELMPNDLLDSIQVRFDTPTKSFIFTPTSGFLERSLSEGKTVVLRGDWPSELKAAMNAFLWRRMMTNSANDHLILVSNDKHDFPFVENEEPNFEIATSKNVIKVTENNRLNAVTDALVDNNCLYISGTTGAGKTHFARHKLSMGNAIFWGETSIRDWIHAIDTSGYIILFIDEANLAGRDWTLFSTLLNKKPAIFYEGQYYELTDKHRVILAGNPLSYGGERHVPRLFKHQLLELEFLPLSLEQLFSRFKLDNDSLKERLITFIKDVNYQFPNSDILTARECLMIGMLSYETLANGITTDEANVFNYYVNQIMQHHIPANSRGRFFKNYPYTLSEMFKAPPLTNMVITDNNRLAFDAIQYHVHHRAQRIAYPHIKPGLGGLVLEGNPGVGKSDLIIQTLVALGLKPNEDFYHIPVSLGYEAKMAMLYKAFHEGKIVIIDEINSSPMIERALNAYLEGHDLDGKKANKPGFLLFGTQNPITMEGRIRTTLPLEHRLQKVTIADYTIKNILHILQLKGVIRPAALSIINGLSAVTDKNLCLRDVLRAAESWLAHNKERPATRKRANDFFPEEIDSEVQIEPSDSKRFRR